MNATTTNHTIPGQPLAHYDPEVAQRVQQWLDSGKPLLWIPIFSRENFPDTPPEILQWIEARQAELHVPIREPADLLRMPEGVTGWLMPEGDADTDVACGVWAGEVYILGVKDRRTGRVQTLLGERSDVATDAADLANQSPV